jgi:hypothetical protein
MCRSLNSGRKYSRSSFQTYFSILVCNQHLPTAISFKNIKNFMLYLTLYNWIFHYQKHTFTTVQ